MSSKLLSALLSIFLFASQASLARDFALTLANQSDREASLAIFQRSPLNEKICVWHLTKLQVAQIHQTLVPEQFEFYGTWDSGRSGTVPRAGTLKSEIEFREADDELRTELWEHPAQKDLFIRYLASWSFPLEVHVLKNGKDFFPPIRLSANQVMSREFPKEIFYFASVKKSVKEGSSITFPADATAVDVSTLGENISVVYSGDKARGYTFNVSTQTEKIR